MEWNGSDSTFDMVFITYNYLFLKQLHIEPKTFMFWAPADYQVVISFHIFTDSDAWEDCSSEAVSDLETSDDIDAELMDASSSAEVW